MAKDSKKYLLVAQEIKLVKILAGNNKKLRDRTLKRLGKWLNDRSNAAPLTEDALMRIWQGLFYAMWMSDKLLIQEECAENISKLVHLQSVESSLLFFKCFLQTMVNEWYGIDHHRKDKFLMLIRRVLRQTLEVLHKFEWQDDVIKKFREILNETALKINENTALGLCLHLNDIFLEELAKVSQGEINENQLLELIQPFAQQLARANDKRQSQDIANHIFKHLLYQSDLGIDYNEKFRAWKRQGFPEGDINSMELITEEGDEQEEVDDENDVQKDLEDLPKDPRAGRVDVILPQLKYNPESIVKLLESLKSKKYTTLNGRKSITKLIKLFNFAAEGTFPLGMTKVNLNELKQNVSVKNAVKDLQNFEYTLSKQLENKAKATRKNKIKEALNKQLNAKQNDTNEEKEKMCSTLEEFIEKSEGHLFKNNKKRKLEQNETNSDVSRKKPKKKLEHKNLETFPIKSQTYFKRNSGMWQVDELELPETLQSPPKKFSDWEKPLNDGETEIFVVSKKTKQKLKHLAETRKQPIEEVVNDFTDKVMNNFSLRKNIVKNPFAELKTPKSEKKIKFSNKIQAQEFKDHQKKVSKSPIIPYDGSKMPVKSLLKPSPHSSPINPFYKLPKNKIKN